MSIKDKLARKTADLMPAETHLDKPSRDTGSPVEPRTPRTGPGQMLAFRAHMQANNDRVTDLEEQLRRYAGSQLAEKLDSQQVVPSRWANRHDSSFINSKYQELKADIESAGGNVQPILVRPGHEAGVYEVVFGHRRHRACLELGLPVLAVVGKFDDRELFAAMDRENRARADLSPFEQGEMYRRALDEGLYSSLREMARQLGVDAGNASKAIGLARLPREVIDAFPSPTAIQFRWGPDLQKALQADPEAVLERGRVLKKAGRVLSAAEVFETLVGIAPKSSHLVTKKLMLNGNVVGKLQRRIDGGVRLEIAAGDGVTERVEELIAKLGFSMS